MKDILFGNNNDQSIKKLAKKSLKANKRRNIMVIIAIALSAFIMSVCEIVSISLVQLQTDQVIDTYEAVYSGITENDVTNLRNASGVERVGEYYLLGNATVNGHTATLVYSDADMLHIGRAQLTLVEGKLPERQEEIVLDRIFLDQQLPDAKVGDQIVLDMNGQKETFILSGVSEMPDIGNGGSSVFLSKAYLKAQKQFDSSEFRSYVHLEDIDYMTEEEAKEFFVVMSQRYDLPRPQYNAQYFSYTSNRSSENILFSLLLAVIILYGGSIVIYSIFLISVSEKIQDYGQLRTIGTTSSQIKELVRREASGLSLIAIPIGLLAGCIASYFLVPMGFSLIGYGSAILLVGCITWLMVRLSIRVPAKIAASTSPIEATRYIPPRGEKTASKKLHRHLTPFKMAFMNFGQNKKRLFNTLASLCFGGILLISVAALFGSYSLEQQTKLDFQFGQFILYGDGGEAGWNRVLQDNPFTEELREELMEMEGVEEIVVTRNSIFCQYSGYFNEEGEGFIDTYNEDKIAEMEKYLLAGTINLEPNSVMVVDMGNSDYRIGEPLLVTVNEQEFQLSIAGFLAPDFSRGSTLLGMDGPMLFVPEETARTLAGTDDLQYSWEIVVAPEKVDTINSQLAAIVEENPRLAMTTYAEKMASYKNQWQTIFGGAQVLTWLIFLFGIVNLINTMLSNHLSRKRDIAIMRSIGLTQKQLYQMLISENLLYVLFSVGISLITGVPISLVICQHIGLAMYGQAMAYQFPVGEFSVYVLVLILVQFVLSYITIRNSKKNSLVEQMQKVG